MKTLLVCALYLEAKPFIKKYNLKPVKTLASFQVFEGEDYALVISGTGKSSSAAATSFISSLHPNAKGIINAGMCGAKNKTIADVFLIDQIIDHDAQRSFYPDISSAVLERSVLRTVSKAETQQRFDELIDMEASGFFEAASYFFSADAIQVIKVVSDNTDSAILDKKNLEDILNNLVVEVEKLIFKENKDNTFTTKEKNEIQLFLNNYNFSLTQQREFLKSVWSLKIQLEDSVKNILSQVFIQLKEGDNKKHIAEKILKTIHGLLRQY